MPSNVGYWWQSRIYSECILKLEESVVYLLNTGCEWSVLDPCVVLTSKEKKTGKLIADRIFMCGLADTFTSCQYYMDFTKQQHSGCVIVSSPFCLSGLDCGLLMYLLRNLYFCLGRNCLYISCFGVCSYPHREELSWHRAIAMEKHGGWSSSTHGASRQAHHRLGGWL